MPKTYRVMRKADEKPLLGASATSLGVRLGIDIQPDASGRVHPGTGGMSVSPSLGALPAYLVPERLRHLVPGARARNNLVVWSMGEGAFVPSPVAAGLRLRIDPKNDHHGFVEPGVEMHHLEYQDALQATRDAWSEDEE